MVMAKSMDGVWEAERKAREIAQKVADLLNEMDALSPGMTVIRPGTISGPGVDVRRIGDRFAIR